jgi:hypothetical protein
MVTLCKAVEKLCLRVLANAGFRNTEGTELFVIFDQIQDSFLALLSFERKFSL